MNRILYLSYTGMLEALGASQVLGYLYPLSKKYKYFLVSYEKPEDMEKNQNVEDLQLKLNQHNITWYPIIYRQGAKYYLSNFKAFVNTAKKILKGESIDIIHCRAYLPALTAYLLTRRNKIPYLFDTRAFWFDEKAEQKKWNKNGLLFRAMKFAERKLYLNATATVMLSKKGINKILNNELFPGGDKIKKIYFVPTCTDLDRFKVADKQWPVKTPTIGYVGTVSGWYDFEKTAKVLSQISEAMDVNIVIFNSGQHDFIKAKLAESGVPATKFKIEKVPFSEMPNRLKEVDISIFFIHPFFSKNASAATKLGELFASGIPVITNKETGDHEYYISEYNTGAIVDTSKLESYNFKEIVQNLLTPETAIRCRAVAEKYFSLEKGVEKYDEIYQSFFKN